MPFVIIRNDITKVKADIIVNTANPEPVYGTGTDAAVYHAAGEQDLLEARKQIGRIAPGEARYTPAFRLPATYIIHTVGPGWIDGSHGEADTLRSCFRNALALARDLGAKSIAFPLIATGNYGFPKDLALKIALESFTSSLLSWPDVKIILVVYSKDSFVLSKNVVGDLETFIDDHYISENEANEMRTRWYEERRRRLFSNHTGEVSEGIPDQQTDESTFAEALMQMIWDRGMKEPDFYGRAGLTKQVFSKIRSHKDYQPSRNTAIACALALHLDQEGTDRLLKKAGFALSRSSKFDLVIMYCIQQKTYDIGEVNSYLFEQCDRQLLNSK